MDETETAKQGKAPVYIHFTSGAAIDHEESDAQLNHSGSLPSVISRSSLRWIAVWFKSTYYVTTIFNTATLILDKTNRCDQIDHVDRHNASR